MKELSVSKIRAGFEVGELHNYYSLEECVGFLLSEVLTLEQQLATKEREVVEEVKKLGDNCACEFSAQPFYMVHRALSEHFKEKP